MQEFNYKWDSVSLTVEKLILQGALDRSIDPENSPVVNKLQTEVRSRSRGKIILIDLTNFGMWDTEGIRAIIGSLIEPLVEKEKAKIAFVGPKTIDGMPSGPGQPTQIFEDAKIKFGIVGTDKLPWEETIEAAIAKLTS